MLQRVRQPLRGRRVAEGAHTDGHGGSRLLFRRGRGRTVRLGTASLVLVVLLSCLVFLVFLAALVLLRVVTVILCLRASGTARRKQAAQTHRTLVCSHEGIVHKERHKTVRKLHAPIRTLFFRTRKQPARRHSSCKHAAIWRNSSHASLQCAHAVAQQGCRRQDALHERLGAGQLPAKLVTRRRRAAHGPRMGGALHMAHWAGTAHRGRWRARGYLPRATCPHEPAALPTAAAYTGRLRCHAPVP